MSHFKGKEPLDHVLDARIRGKLASAEIHGAELPGHISAAADASKETAILILILWILLGEITTPLFFVFMAGWLIWKVGRSAILGWSRLERLHRVIEEERWEIEHHRPQEKQELRALYAAKGFSGRLLDEVIDVLMADDNRLLQIMLEEELNLSLETHEHPLKQATGALIGVAGSAILMTIALLLPNWAPPLFAAILIALSAGATAHLEKNAPFPSIIWNLAIATLATMSVILLKKMYLA